MNSYLARGRSIIRRRVSGAFSAMLLLRAISPVPRNASRSSVLPGWLSPLRLTAEKSEVL